MQDFCTPSSRGKDGASVRDITIEHGGGSVMVLGLFCWIQGQHHYTKVMTQNTSQTYDYLRKPKMVGLKSGLQNL